MHRLTDACGQPDYLIATGAFIGNVAMRPNARGWSQSQELEAKAEARRSTMLN